MRMNEGEDEEEDEDEHDDEDEDDDEDDDEQTGAPPSALRGLTSRIYSGAQVILGGGDEGP